VLDQFLDELRAWRSQDEPKETHVFYLRPDDEVASILDRLDWAGDARVIFVIPPDTSLLVDRLDLLRVQRYAARRRIGMALVTLNAEQYALARELRIPIFGSLERAQRGRWRYRPLSALPVRKGERPSFAELHPGDSRAAGYLLLGMTGGLVFVLLYDLLTISTLELKLIFKDAPLGIVGGGALGLLTFLSALLMRRHKPRLFRWVRWGFMLLVFVLGLLAPLAAGYIITPGARLTVTPAQHIISAIARITVVVPGPEDEGLEEIDFEGQRIAGRRVSAEVSGEAVAAATGTADVPSSRATGAVLFSNSLAQEYTVGRGTTVRTSAGQPVRFITTGDVTLPPLGQAAVGVEAMEPGPQGNVDAGLINRVEGAVARAVRVTNPEPTRGGGVSEVRAVTQADRDALQRTLLVELQKQGYDRVLERPQDEGGLQPGEYLVPGSVRVFQVLHKTYDRFATEEAESVKLEMRIAVTGVVVDLGDAYNLARRVLLGRLLEGYELIEIEYTPGLMGDNVIGDGTLTFFVEVKGVVKARLQNDRVKRWLRGKSLDAGMALLDANRQSGHFPVAATPEAEIWPDWSANRFPWLLWRIQVVESE
jgi:hypothetical protein